MIKSLLAKAAARLKEPSTYAAITALVMGAGLKIDAGLVQNIVIALSGLIGIVAFVLPEKK